MATRRRRSRARARSRAASRAASRSAAGSGGGGVSTGGGAVSGVAAVPACARSLGGGHRLVGRVLAARLRQVVQHRLELSLQLAPGRRVEPSALERHADAVAHHLAAAPLHDLQGQAILAAALAHLAGDDAVGLEAPGHLGHAAGVRLVALDLLGRGHVRLLADDRGLLLEDLDDAALHLGALGAADVEHHDSLLGGVGRLGRPAQAEGEGQEPGAAADQGPRRPATCQTVRSRAHCCVLSPAGGRWRARTDSTEPPCPTRRRRRPTRRGTAARSRTGWSSGGPPPRR